MDPEMKKIVQLTNKLTVTEEYQFKELIDISITDRYSGDLERHEDPRCKRADSYTPLDTDNIRELLVALWGERLSVEELEAAFERLTADGCKRWPHGYCVDDEEEMQEEAARERDYEEAVADNNPPFEDER